MGDTLAVEALQKMVQGAVIFSSLSLVILRCAAFTRNMHFAVKNFHAFQVFYCILIYYVFVVVYVSF